MSNGRILVIEDDPTIIDLIRTNLDVRGYEVHVSTDGLSIPQLVQRVAPEVVLLDLMLPDADGFDICAELRETSSIGLIVVSARDAEHDKVRALNLGADDYLTKPFGVEELIARVAATLRRSRQAAATGNGGAAPVGDIRLDPTTRSAWRGSDRIQLTATEYTLLALLIEHHGQVLTYTDLLDRVWGQGYHHSRDYVRVYIGRLRTKLERPGDAPLIFNEPRVGYRFVGR